jgi:hypothetical protein
VCIDDELLHRNYYQSSNNGSSTTPSFNDDMKRDAIFKNPNAVNYMLNTYKLDDYAGFLPRRATAANSFYDVLRTRQNQDWAQETYVSSDSGF